MRVLPDNHYPPAFIRPLAGDEMTRLFWALLAVSVASPALAQDKPDPVAAYVRKSTRGETAAATLANLGLPNLAGKWYYAGPFDNTDRTGFDTAYPPEQTVDLTATYTGKNGARVTWKELPRFAPGVIYDLLPLFRGPARRDAVVYVYHEFESKAELKLPVYLGADDTLTVWFNGTKLLAEDHERAVHPFQYSVELNVKPGTNRLLLKICQYGGEWKFVIGPEFPSEVSASLRKFLDRDWPVERLANADITSPVDEAKFYSVTTIPLPEDCVLEVGGLGFRPDGKLFACTRRGEVWLIHNPESNNPADVKFTRFASGLHEALGLWVEDNNTVYVVQRPELTKLIDTNGDGTADKFVTVSDKWGVSGDYHEFAFGPARDKDGNFFVTLNVGFGGGHQAKAPWRGWCVKVTPDGNMEPWAYGLRSPNGINFSPDGELFYVDNQGEWVASNKMHHLKRGKFYGHQASLQWVKNSPFAGKVPERVRSGMLYDGQKGPDANSPSGFPDLDPPCIWFPYGRMGQSASEPQWDTTNGKFGPFAGQCFVGDQTRSMVMRVALEKVNGVYQGACFPFRSGLQCGVNRITFGPDGAMYVGQTNRGWGSVGGKPYGLQRIHFTGVMPFEIHHVALTAKGFDLTFTKPVNSATAALASNYAMKSFTYVYFSTYGCPETDTQAEAVTAVKVSEDGKTVSLTVPNLRKGRVYDLRLTGVKSVDGDDLLHSEAYYTLNELVGEQLTTK
jgi:hypothetical protein